MLLQVLEQDAADAMDDGLRGASRARGEEHIERLVEGRAGETELGGAGVSEGRRRHDVDTDGRRQCFGPVGQDQKFETRQLAADLDEALAEVVASAGIPVESVGEEDLGLDLPDPVEDRHDAEVRRAGGPGRPERGGRQQGHESREIVRLNACDAIPDADAATAKPVGNLRHLLPQVVPRHVAREAGLVAEVDHDLVARPGEKILREVQSRFGKPPGTQHAAVGSGLVHRRAAVTDDRAEAPERPPEGCWFGDRPPMQNLVGLVLEADHAREPRHVRSLDGVRRRGPEDLSAHRGAARPRAVGRIRPRHRHGFRSSPVGPDEALLKPDRPIYVGTDRSVLLAVPIGLYG